MQVKDTDLCFSALKLDPFLDIGEIQAFIQT